jgi:hypothetical protein
MSAQQSRLGADVDVLVVDDPFESPEEADRLEVRDAVDKTITHYTMRLSRGGSTVLVMSRFHPDDAIGRRIDRKAESWSYVHKPAIEVVDGVEVPLSPEVRTLEELHAIRAALANHDGDILAFLPGMGEIRRTEQALAGCGALVLPLHGDLPPDLLASMCSPPSMIGAIAASVAARSPTRSTSLTLRAAAGTRSSPATR